MFQCVYSIQCLDPEIKEFYIGSTDNFKKRCKNHTMDYDRDCNRKLYKFIRENGGISNWEINYIQQYKFLTKEELRVYEQWYIDTYKPELNTKKAYSTEEEKKEYKKKWNIDNIETQKENKKKYYEKNKSIISANRKEKSKCPYCNLEMRKNNIPRHIKKYCKSTSI
tara:strand:- start:349 stop:849 length:501 start_codon:yes stop_codon:yes gene_type:complete